jgi:hypothetical protein
MIDFTQPKPYLEMFKVMPTDMLLKRMMVGVQNFDPRVLKMDDAKLDTFFQPDAGVGRWSCRVLLGHLADAEIVYLHRMRKVMAEDKPMLQNWDEDAFVDRGLYGTPQTGSKFPIGAYVATIYTLRKWLADWIPTLSEADMARSGMHPMRGELSIRTMLESTTYHVEHHAWYLNAKVAKLS